MAGKFTQKPFSEINLEDPLFDSLKCDYPDFSDWFYRKSTEGRKAIVFNDEQGLGAFVALKREHEPISTIEGSLPQAPRVKICTLCLAERFRGQRLGEGAIGLVLWQWQKSKQEEIYVTVFPKHSELIQQLERFGFILAGHNHNGEGVYLRSRTAVDYSDPFKSFPFISPKFAKGGYLIVRDSYHDTLFPYSELKNTTQQQLAIDAANGVSKVYVGNAWQVHYQIGEPIFIYRQYSGATGKRYKSCVTSYCVATNIIYVKRNGMPLMTYPEFCNAIGNKSVFNQKDLHDKYTEDKNLTVIHLLYYGYFGAGNNVNLDWLDNNGLWSPKGSDIYPANLQLTPQQSLTIFEAAGADINNIFLDE